MASVNYDKRKAKRVARRSKLIALLGGKCKKCGTTKNLEFDHIDKNTKTMDIAHSIDTKEDRLLNEIKKCQLLCRDCHVLKGSGRDDAGAWDYARPRSDHGTVHHYRNHGCRCEKCREAVSKYYYSKLASVSEIYLKYLNG